MLPKTFRIPLVILLCLILAAGSGIMAAGLMDSLFEYHSPLHDSPPAPGEALGAPLSRQVVFVLIDGLRLDTSLDSETMPFLNSLRGQGAWGTMHSQAPSYSQPGYSVLLSGAWPEFSDGPALNIPYQNIPTWTQDNIFSAAKRSGLKTAVSGYNWFEKLIPQSDLDASFYTPGEDHAADLDVLAAALPWLNSGSYDFVLIHIDQLDYAGHYQGGPLDPRWDAAARRADDLLCEIASSLDLTQDTLLITSDHGHIDQGGHGGHDPVTLIEPFVLVGAGVRPGAYPDLQMVDIAPTIAVLLGTNIPAANQGHVLSDLLIISPEYEQTLGAALELQGVNLLHAYQNAIKSQATLQPGDDPVNQVQTALYASRDARLRAERWPRFVLACGLLLLSMILLRSQRPKNLPWLITGAGLYILIFNLRYVLIDQRTYSFSSVLYPQELIVDIINAAIIALSAAWLLTAIGQRIFRKAPHQAVEATLEQTLTIIYTLALPVLWHYAQYGLLVTWSLPDMASTFMTLIALLQIIFVATFGILFAGLAALISWCIHTR